MIANGAILAFVIAGNGFLKKRNPNQALFFFCITLLQLLFLSIRLFPAATGLYGGHLFLLFLFYPLLYYYFEKLLHVRVYLNRFFYLNLVPAALFAVFFALFFPQNGGEGPLLHIPVLRYGIIALCASYLYYSVIIEVKLMRHWYRAFSKTISILMILLFLDLFCFSLLVFAGYAYDPVWIAWGHVLMSFIVLVLHFVNTRYPVFLESIETIKSYQKTRIKNLDVSRLEERLSDLFETEKIFMDEAISLKALATLCDVTVHQLSEFINVNWQSGFFNLINRFRVQEAQRLLLDNPDANVLNIAFRVGFNNKASFNAAFKKFTGQTPLQFRRERRSGND